jgi:hypothetical protein
MEVSVRLVVFWHPGENRYCSYCPALQCSFARAESVEKCIQILRDNYLLYYLKNRHKCTNLQHYGWAITDQSVLSPVFSDDDCHRLTKQSYERAISQYQIIQINVEVP